MIKRYLIDEDIILRDFLETTDLSSNLITRITNGNGRFIVNDQNVNKSYLLKKGDKLEIVLPVSDQGDNILSIKGDFDIVYEDVYLLIINKAANISCIPTIKHFDHSLANYVMSYYKRNGILSNIHFVNRLDAMTSGLVILAKNSYINDLMKNAKITKKYLIEVEGNLDKEGIIETGIRRISEDTIKREVTFDFINSKTEYKVLGKNAFKNDTTFVEATLHTGKTHQLRLHFQHLGFPIVGDSLYGKKNEEGILHLHSYYLSFIHPVTEEKIQLSTYPEWFLVMLESHQLDHN
jgi:23S rRNA pseudouridine1911/1915/1917 synthase